MKTQPLKDNSGDNASDSTFGSVFGDAGSSEGGAGGSQFGNTSFGDTNAATDIFKGVSGDADEKKKKMILIGASSLAILVCLGLGMYLISDSGEEDAAISDEATPAVVVPPPVVAAPETTDDVAAAAAVAEEGTDEPTDEVEVATAPTLGSGSSYTYNERDGGPIVTAEDGAAIEVSRASDFSSLYVAGTAKGGQFRIPNPPPGEIFWRQQGGSEVHKISVAPPPRLAVSFSSPGKVAAGAALSWSASGAKAAFYRVELAVDGEFSNIASVVSTKGMSAALNNVSAGSYHVRVGGFNESAGKWEYSGAGRLEVQ